MKLIVDAVSAQAVRLLFLAVLATLAVGCSSSDSDPLETEFPDEELPDENPDENPDEGPTALCDGDSNVSGGFLAAWSDNCTLNFQNSDGSPGPYANSSYTRGVQRILWCLGYDEGETNIDVFADGVFGRNTENAVRAWQTDEGLVSDGIVGPASWTRLEEQLLGPNEFDADTDWFAVDSAERCVGDIQFYQERAGNRAWTMEATPSDGSTITPVPFSIDPP